jgi:pyrroloquinoline quinone (PQQ) biosynthesis protein C
MDGQVLQRLPADRPSVGTIFEQTQDALARFNRARLTPGIGIDAGAPDAQAMLAMEQSFIRSLRQSVAPFLKDLPADPPEFMHWYEDLKETGPGQGDPLFPWIAAHATPTQLRWFLAQEIAGEAGFEDLLAMTQVKMPPRAKLEMARNYWDEMGRGKERGMHGPMLDRLVRALELQPAIETTVAPALALGNVMVGLAFNRCYAFQSVGALGVIELTAPTRAGYVSKALARIGISRRDSHYFALHAVIDRRHSRSWNLEVIESLVTEDPSRMRPIAEGALLRLWCGLRCFDRYRQEFGVPT